MQEEVFEDDDVAKYMNEYFVNIKVDREERPIDAILGRRPQDEQGQRRVAMTVVMTLASSPSLGNLLPKARFIVMRQTGDPQDRPPCHRGTRREDHLGDQSIDPGQPCAGLQQARLARRDAPRLDPWIARMEALSAR